VMIEYDGLYIFRQVFWSLNAAVFGSFVFVLDSFF